MCGAGRGCRARAVPFLPGVHHRLHFLEEETEVQRGERLVAAASVGHAELGTSPGCQALLRPLGHLPWGHLPRGLYLKRAVNNLALKINLTRTN